MKLIMPPFSVDLHWRLLYVPDTGRGTGMFEIGTEVAAVIQMNIMGGQVMIDLHMSVLYLSVLGLNVTAIAHHLTVS